MHRGMNQIKGESQEHVEEDSGTKEIIKEQKMRVRDVMFLIATGALVLICGPYIYYTAIVYQHIWEHAEN